MVSNNILTGEVDKCHGKVRVERVKASQPESPERNATSATTPSGAVYMPIAHTSLHLRAESYHIIVICIVNAGKAIIFCLTS